MANVLIVDDSSDTVEQSAQVAGLRHVDPDTMTVRRGAGFAYLDRRGRRLRDPATM